MQHSQSNGSDANKLMTDQYQTLSRELLLKPYSRVQSIQNITANISQLALKLSNKSNISHSVDKLQTFTQQKDLNNNNTIDLNSITGGVAFNYSNSIDLQDSGLTRKFIQDLKQRNGDEGYIFATFADQNALDFVYNWVQHVQQLNIKNYVVGALDKFSYKSLQDSDINVVQIADYSGEQIKFMSDEFLQLGLTKIEYILNMTRLNATAVVTDSDVFWINDPREYFNRYMDADVLVAGENNIPTFEDDGLEYLPQVEYGINIGIMVVRPKAQGLMQDWLNKTKIDGGWDQSTFTSMVNETATHLDSPNRVFSSYNDSYKFGVLPAKLFLNGNTFFVLRLHEYFDVRPYAAHVSNTPYGKFGKKFRYREEGLWIDDDEYYNPNNTKFISLKIDIPEIIKIKSKPDFSKEGLATYLGHIDLANYQFKQLRAALAFAWMFDRILILPQWLCGGLISPQGVIGLGHFGKQIYPNKCDSDVYLNLGHVNNYPYADKFKYNFQFREHTFLSNPKTPVNLTNSKITINECIPGSWECTNPSQTIETKRGSPMNDGVYLPMNSNDLQIKKMMLKMHDYKVWELYNPTNVFQGFADPEENLQFLEQIRHYTAEGFRPLWSDPVVHYDISWDIVPHVDAHGKFWNETWYPQQV